MSDRCSLCNNDLCGESDKTKKIGVCYACRQQKAGFGVKTHAGSIRGLKHRTPTTGTERDVRYSEAMDDACRETDND